MRQPCVRATGKRRPRRLHLRIGQPDVIEARPRTSVSDPSGAIIGANMPSLDEFARQKLGDARAGASAPHAGRRPTGSDDLWVERDGRRLLSFSCNDYLGLSQHPALKAAAIAAIERHGVGAGASRLVTGNHPLYAELEQRLARLKGTEAACVFGSGYLANAGIAPALVGRDDLILIDELAHSSLWTGARLSRARGACRSATTTPAMSRDLLEQHRARPPARADRHRRRVLDGRRPRAAAELGDAGARVRRLADGRRRPRPRFRPRAAQRRRAAAASARCPRRSAPTAAISAPRSR